MKATKKIVGATAALVAAVALSAGSTFAWFATNNSANVSGMNVSVTGTNDYLLIRAEGQNFSNTSTATFSGSHALKPCTSSATSTGTPSNIASYNLQIPSGGTIDDETGILTGGSLTDITSNTGYYYDYVIYLANLGASVSDKTLTISFDTVSVSSTIQNAVSVDFYLSNSTTSNDNTDVVYYGTLNLAGKENKKTPSPGEKTSVVISNFDLPAGNYNEQTGLKVVMRTYVDGALYNGADELYVNSVDYVDTAIGFTVKFELS